MWPCKHSEHPSTNPPKQCQPGSRCELSSHGNFVEDTARWRQAPIPIRVTAARRLKGTGIDMRLPSPIWFLGFLLTVVALTGVRSAHAEQRRVGLGLDLSAEAIHLQLELRPMRRVGLTLSAGRTLGANWSSPYDISTVVGARVYLLQKRWMSVFVGGTLVRRFSARTSVRDALEDTFSINRWRRDSWFVGPTVGITFGKSRGLGVSVDLEEVLNFETGRSIAMTGMRLDWAF